MSDLVGAIVAGKYRVKRCIGAGGMGAVYEGEHIEIGKRVAIKIINKEKGRSAEVASRFKREARAASAVESEHIVKVFDVGTDDAVGLFMVMEYLEGEDLSSRMEREGRLPQADAIMIATQAARGLAKAHAAGVVHRDLKPANLFLTSREDGDTCVKILDFGISKLSTVNGDAGGSQTITLDGTIVGTPMYMSPEQAQGTAVDARSDIWSLGAVLYEMLVGQPPYQERSTYQLMIVQIVTQPPRPLSTVAPFVPDALARVVHHAMTASIEDRIADAATFASLLADAVGVPSPPWSSSRGLPATSSQRLAAYTPPSSRSSVVPDAQTLSATPQPTGIGLVLHTGDHVAGLPKPFWSGLGGRLALGALALALLAGAFVVFGRSSTNDPGAAKPASESRDERSSRGASSPPMLAPVPPPVPAPARIPSLSAASASAHPSAVAKGALAGSPNASTAIAPIPPMAPIPLVPVRVAPPASPSSGPPAGSATPQYGAAGVSTAY